MATLKRLVGSGAALLLLAACAPAGTPAPATPATPTRGPAAAASTPTTVPAPERVSIGWVRSINIASFNVAEGRGYFRELGIAIEPTEFRSAADIVSALGTGQLDVNGGTISAGTFNAWQRGVKMIVAAPTSVFPPEGELMPQNAVVRKELWDSGALRSLADARGRRIGVNVRGGINEFVVLHMLGRRGLTLADVELVPLGFPDHPAALANGSIDVSTASEPFGTVAIDQGVGVRLEEDQRSIGPIQPTHFLFSEHFSTVRADAATRFLAAILRANREMQGRWVDNPELAKIVEDEIGIRRDLLVRAVLPQYPLDLTPRLADIQAMQEAFLKEGHLTYSALIDVTPFVNTALAERARQLLDARR